MIENGDLLFEDLEQNFHVGMIPAQRIDELWHGVLPPRLQSSMAASCP
jgi:hypothetical protein